MWCDICAQDVPSVASGLPGERACARCGKRLRIDGSHEPRPEPTGRDKSASLPSFDAQRTEASQRTFADFDDWQLEDELRHVERLVLRGAAVPAQPTTAHLADNALGSQWHVDQPHRPVQPPEPSAPSRPDRQPRGSFLAWLCLSVGTMAFACGAVLVGWSYYENRPELWQMGMPAAMAGQIGLLIGLVMQLERLGQQHRHAAGKLADVDRQLGRLQQTTELLGSTHTSASQAFYAHMAGGANSRVLLSDLKGQLDLLAVRMSQER